MPTVFQLPSGKDPEAQGSTRAATHVPSQYRSVQNTIFAEFSKPRRKRDHKITQGRKFVIAMSIAMGVSCLHGLAHLDAWLAAWTNDFKIQ